MSRKIKLLKFKCFSIPTTPVENAGDPTMHKKTSEDFFRKKFSAKKNLVKKTPRLQIFLTDQRVLIFFFVIYTSILHNCHAKELMNKTVQSF